MLTLSQIRRSEARQRTYKDGDPELCDCFQRFTKHGDIGEDVAADSPRQERQEPDSTTSDKQTRRAP